MSSQGPAKFEDEVLLFFGQRKVPLFKSVEPIVVLEVVRHMKTVLALPGDIVIRKGSTIGVYIISGGAAGWCRRPQPGAGKVVEEGCGRRHGRG